MSSLNLTEAALSILLDAFPASKAFRTPAFERSIVRYIESLSLHTLLPQGAPSQDVCLLAKSFLAGIVELNEASVYRYFVNHALREELIVLKHQSYRYANRRRTEGVLLCGDRHVAMEKAVYEASSALLDSDEDAAWVAYQVSECLAALLYARGETEREAIASKYRTR